MIDILSHPESTIDPPRLRQEQNFQNLVSDKPGKRYFMIGFYTYRKCFP